MTEKPLGQKGARDEPLIDLESKMKAFFDVSDKAYAYQREPLKVKETIMDEATELKHKRMREK